MSTNCKIGLKFKRHDGTELVEYIYCHHDGYPEYAGNTLRESYTKLDIVRELLDLGDLSSIEPTTDDCDAYCRDHDESWGSCRPEFATVDEFIAMSDGPDYVYLGEYDETSRTVNWLGYDGGELMAW